MIWSSDPGGKHFNQSPVDNSIMIIVRWFDKLYKSDGFLNITIAWQIPYIFDCLICLMSATLFSVWGANNYYNIMNLEWSAISMSIY